MCCFPFDHAASCAAVGGLGYAAAQPAEAKEKARRRRDAVTAWRLERDRYAGRRLDQLEAEWEGGRIDAAEYKKKRKEILRGLK